MAEPKPKQSIRRFDVFAEYQRLKGLQDRMSEDEAQGYGIWLAKVVAARRFGKARGAGEEKEEGRRPDETRELVDNKWRSLDGEPQTDELFEKEIVQRMGSEFYEQVFAPAIQEAFNNGKDYKEIRDAIRKDWKP